MKHGRFAFVILITMMSFGCGGDQSKPEEVLLEDFIVNLSGQQKSYLKAKVVLVTSGAKDKKLIEGAKSRIRNVIISRLREIKAEDAKDSKSSGEDLMETLRKDIMNRVNSNMDGDPVTAVYFTTFVFQ